MSVEHIRFPSLEGGSVQVGTMFQLGDFLFFDGFPYLSNIYKKHKTRQSQL